MDRFENEANVYQTTLRDMQGHCIPTFYGLYKATQAFDRDDAICIITEDCGTSIGLYANIAKEWLYVSSFTIARKHRNVNALWLLA